MGLSEDLGPGTVAIDTAIFIYFIEEDPRYLSLIVPLFEDADAGRRELVTSALTLLEVLVVPYRIGDVQLAEHYELLLTQSRGIRMIDVTRDQLRAAAQLRAATGVKTPDALQVVAALGAGCRAFLTNDRGLPSIPSLRIVQLSSYIVHR
jgi:predicted nucleic acid-binding protein